MNAEEAKACLNNFAKEQLSRVSEAIDVLYKEYGSYKSISEAVPVSAKVLSRRHRIFLLPGGIFWKVSEGKIGVEHAYQISRLTKEHDQWLLAFTIIEEELNTKECKKAVNVVLEQKRELKEVLNTLFGILFDKIQPLLLPLPFGLQFAINRAAWSKRQEWGDLCLKFIRQGLSVDIQKVVEQLGKLLGELERGIE